MPIAFKEWAVTVRALAEGEQLVTLRKGGIREEHKHFELEHDRFFLYPTFEHQRNDVVRASHQPELRRALEEGVWPDEEPPPHALTRDGGIPQPDRVRIRAWAQVVEHFTVTDPRVVDALSPYYVWTTDYAEKRLLLEAPPPAARPAPAHPPHPAARHRQGARRLPRLQVVARDHARPALRGHAGPVRRRVRSRARADRVDLPTAACPRWSERDDARHRRRAAPARRPPGARRGHRRRRRRRRGGRRRRRRRGARDARGRWAA